MQCIVTFFVPPWDNKITHFKLANEYIIYKFHIYFINYKFRRTTKIDLKFVKLGGKNLKN